MARLIRHDKHGPIKIEPQERPVWICQCGLSQNLPYCDGSHKRSSDEQPGMVYVYDATRTHVIETRPETSTGPT